jgi:hypothetical protein
MPVNAMATMELLKTQDVCQILHKNRGTIQMYREAGLLRMFRLGKSFVTTREELDRFANICLEYGFNLSSPERIILAGQALKKGSDHHQ